MRALFGRWRALLVDLLILIVVSSSDDWPRAGMKRFMAGVSGEESLIAAATAP
jgi:hypothetical protein